LALYDFVTRKITIALSNILKGKQDKLVLGNINSLRDWGHARDYVQGMWLMLQKENLVTVDEFNNPTWRTGKWCVISSNEAP
jgi:GDP-D-mannose dehydratase